MIDFDDFDCEPCELGYDPSGADAPVSDGGGFGFGSGMFFGGALGLLLGGGRRRETEYVPVDPDLGSFTNEEKDFLAQVWRMEKEIEEAWKAESWERLCLLLHAVSASLQEGWGEFLPEHPDYDPSPKFHAELDQHLMPLLERAQEGARLDFTSYISPERLQELEDGDVSMNYESMTFTLNGQPIS
tara:strand:+ start:65 stop:622 length:558 start_codon:yes stop_codon:yes gene_type:complete